jgi:hypothetical protein
LLFLLLCVSVWVRRIGTDNFVIIGIIEVIVILSDAAGVSETGGGKRGGEREARRRIGKWSSGH